ncbi:alpha/beta fold hydrolase [Flavobacterium sp.]
MNAEVSKWESMGNYFTYENKKIFYFQDGCGEDVLIIHGYPFNSFEWKNTIEELSLNFRVTIFDLLGMGFSDKPHKHKYSFEEYCDITNQLLKELKITEVHILSHDLGVSIAQELMTTESENNFRIKSCAFMNGSLFIDAYKPRFIQKLLSKSPLFIGKVLSRIMTKKMVLSSIKSVFGPFTRPTDDFLDKQWEILIYKDGKSIAYLLGRLVFEKWKYLDRWTRAMQNTSIPMCYICGPFDPNSGMNMARRHEELIPNSKIYLLDKYIGHWPQLEDQQTMLKLYYSFLDTVEARKIA